ncbi:MAG: alpha/beta hydrolase [Pirellulales bacterium]|nr:alpha/beta hydrolase [Pirellulales bacterium]
MRSFRYRNLLRPLGLLAAAYLAIMGIMMLLEESLLFYPVPYPEGESWEPRGLTFEDAWFSAADGVRLHGWFVPHEQARAVVLFCHGNAGNVTHWADTLWTLHNQVGVSVLSFDYRGYGRSEGSPNEPGMYADARAARAWLASRTGKREEEIVLMGRSLGGAVAVELAAVDGAKGLVLESTFSSVPDVAASIYRWLPVRWLIRNRFDAVGRISGYRGPLLQSHSETDEIVPYSFARRLFEQANEPKQLITLRGVGHNDPQTPAYYEALVRFLDGLADAGAIE